MTIGRERSSTRPRRRLPASMAMSMKYGNELREMRSVPSRSAAIDSYDAVSPMSHREIDGKLRPCFFDAMFESSLSYSLSVSLCGNECLILVCGRKKARRVLNEGVGVEIMQCDM